MNYETLLREHGLKVTPQRLGILSAIQEEGHMGIDDLFLQIKKKFPSISLATLYKNINTMVDVELLKEVALSGLKSRYEISKAAHAHLLCEKCGQLKDLDFDLKDLSTKIEYDSHYRMNRIDLMLSGVCPDCQRQD